MQIAEVATAAPASAVSAVTGVKVEAAASPETDVKKEVAAVASDGGGIVERMQVDGETLEEGDEGD
eukprot:6040089-Pleurochrysis_carterae.AAC.1